MARKKPAQEPENRKKAGAYTRDVIIGMLEKLQEEAGK